MSYPLGLRSRDGAHSGRLHGWDGDGRFDLGHDAYRSCTTPRRGRGRLGLEGEHRELALCGEDEEQPGNGTQFEFTTDWTIVPSLVIAPERKPSP